MLGRIVRPADFQRLLATPPKARSAHFAAHHLSERPGRPRQPDQEIGTGELSTVAPYPFEQPVDDQRSASPGSCWLGITVPKRHAREATTRNLLRRQIRAVVRDCADALPQGLWLVRLRAPFDRQRFRSPTSVPLREQARTELTALMRRACA